MKYGILALGITILSMLVMEFNSRTTDLNSLIVERDLVSTQLAQREQTKTALEAQIAVATSEAAVDRWAHEDGHMVKEGEISVVPISSGQVLPTPTPTPLPPVQETETPNGWLLLILGPKGL